MKRKQEVQEPSLLKSQEHSAHFLYPVQPQQVSAFDPLQKSNEEIYSSEISIQNQSQKITFVKQIVDNTFQEKDELKKLPVFLKEFPFLSDDYKFKERTEKIFTFFLLRSTIIQIMADCTIILVLVLLPLQIAFNDQNSEILCSIIVLMKMIQFLNDYFQLVSPKKLIKEYAKQQLPLHIIIILTYLMISQDDVQILQWSAYFLIFMYFKRSLDTVVYQIQKYVVCGLPEQQISSQQFCIAGKVILILHILNCYMIQSLNQVGNSYFVTLKNITIKVITLNNNTEYQNEQVSLALFVSYLFLILIITGANQQCNQLQRDLQIYFKQNNIPIKLKLKIYEELMNKSNKSIHIHEQLSQELQEQIAYSQRITFIQDNFSSYDEATKFKLTQLCTTQYYKSGQCIMKLKQQDDNALYYLIQGKASIQLPKQVKIQLKCKSTFGQLSFFTQCLRTATILCDQNCVIYKLQRQQFLDCLTHHDKQLFQLTKDQIEFHQSLPIKCFCCQQPTHVLVNCPNVSYYSEHRLQISRNNNLTQPRASCNYRFHLDRRNSVKSAKSLVKFKDSIKLKKPSDSQSHYSSSNQPHNKEDISLIQNLDNPFQDSQRILSEKVLSEKYGSIRGQLLSSGRIHSLQDAHKEIPQVIQEISYDSMSIKSLKDDKEIEIVPQKLRRNRSNKPSKKFINYAAQVEPNSESSLNLSPIFQGDQSHPSNPQLPKWGTLIKSQGSNTVKPESAFRSGFSSFQVFSGNENPIYANQNSKDDIDKMHIFELYYPRQNYDQIIK